MNSPLFDVWFAAMTVLLVIAGGAAWVVSAVRHHHHRRHHLLQKPSPSCQRDFARRDFTRHV